MVSHGKTLIPCKKSFGHGLKIQVHPVTQDLYFLTESKRVLYKSSDFGDTWTGKNVNINGDLIIDKNYPNRFFGATIVSGIYVGGVYFSEDAGESFTFGGLAGTSPLLALNGTSTKLYAAFGAGIYVASDITPAETITNPTAPSGPITGTISKNYTYSVGGSVSNLGHPIEYQFEWNGDGSDLSPWGAAAQAKTWTDPGAYNIRARARCTTDTSVLSNWSNPLSVSISIPNISVTPAPAAYDFGSVKVKKSKANSWVVKNGGTANLSITAAITGPDASMFRITGSGSKTIKPGKSLTMKVTFKPASTGTKTSTLEITSNDPTATTLDIPLSGTGQ